MEERDDKQAAEPQDPELGLPIDEHEEEVSVGGRIVRHRGIYLLPNLLTTGALFAGFYAIVAGMSAGFETTSSVRNAQFEAASIAIFVAMFFDGLDGRVARLTGTSSAFGVQYDSLSDMVSFGVAPALVSFSWALSSMGKLGWAATFIYIAGAALRLARFNTQVGTTDNRYFRGLASPAAAALLASLVWSCADFGLTGDNLSPVISFAATLLTAVAGLLMVSNFRYTSFKKFDMGQRYPFVVILVLVLVLGVITIDPPRLLLLMAIAYALSGPGMLLWRRAAGSNTPA